MIKYLAGCATEGSKPSAMRKLETSEEVESPMSNLFRGL
jgi:hypothetical protein